MELKRLFAEFCRSSDAEVHSKISIFRTSSIIIPTGVSMNRADCPVQPHLGDVLESPKDGAKGGANANPLSVSCGNTSCPALVLSHRNSGTSLNLLRTGRFALFIGHCLCSVQSFGSRFSVVSKSWLLRPSEAAASAANGVEFEVQKNIRLLRPKKWPWMWAAF